jgi:hypothetical protein
MTGAIARHGFAAFAVAAATLGLAGCAGSTPGAGWSRAPDLSVYGAMRVYANKSVEHDILCHRVSPDRASAEWDRQFSSRQAWVDRAMAQRYGAEAIAHAPTPYTPRIQCTDVPDFRWQEQYARLLRLLEVRFGLMPERGG